MVLDKKLLKEFRYNSRVYEANKFNVDTDVKEVFGLLKAKAKIPISSLVSFILEDWLTKHRNDISSLIKQKKNRFL